MRKTKCITFDKNAQDSLPQHIKDKMAKQRASAFEEQESRRNAEHARNKNKF